MTFILESVEESPPFHTFQYRFLTNYLTPKPPPFLPHPPPPTPHPPMPPPFFARSIAFTGNCFAAKFAAAHPTSAAAKKHGRNWLKTPPNQQFRRKKKSPSHPKRGFILKPYTLYLLEAGNWKLAAIH